MMNRLTNWAVLAAVLGAAPAARAADPATTPPSTRPALPPVEKNPRPKLTHGTAGTASTFTAPLLSTNNRPLPNTGPPASYSVSRTNEDYTYLLNPANRTDFFDPVKRIQLGSDPSVYATFGLEVRERYENFDTATFGPKTPHNQGYYLTRVVTTGDLHVGPNVRFLGTIKDSLENNRVGGPRASDIDTFSVDQALALVTLPVGGGNTVSFAGGRQYLLYGDQRLIGAFDWGNTRRTFDGFKVTLASKGGEGSVLENYLDAFWTRPVAVNKYAFDNDVHTSAFYGIYDTILFPKAFNPKSRTGLDVYILGLSQKARPAVYQSPAVASSSDTYTVGTRFATTPLPWDADVEADYQFGRNGNAGGLISAYSLATEGGYTLVDDPLAPRGGLGFDVASGDHSAANPNKQTFNQLFPTGHLFFGFADFVGRENIIDVHPNLTATFVQNKPFARLVSGRVDYHVFWRQNVNDSLYAASGAVQRATTATSRDPFVGDELDVLFNWQVDGHLSFYSGYSHFFTGGFLRQTPGGDHDSNFVYGELSYVF